jgi:hypothetical protein
MLWINNVVFHSPGFETHKELVALLHINGQKLTWPFGPGELKTTLKMLRSNLTIKEFVLSLRYV